MRFGERFRFANTRRERRSPWCDQSATHPSQKAAKDGAPTVWLAIGRPGHPVESFLVIHNNICYCFRIMRTADKSISFRADAEKIDTLDSLAAAQDRPRSYLINEAITNYIELHTYQDALVRKGLEEMRKGRVVRHEEVVKQPKQTSRARQLSSRLSSK